MPLPGMGRPACRHCAVWVIAGQQKRGRPASVPNNEYRKRNEKIAERLRTPAAPRIKEAAERRKFLMNERGWNRRACALAIALQMEESVRSVRSHLRLYDADPAKYDGLKLAPLTWDDKKWPPATGI